MSRKSAPIKCRLLVPQEDGSYRDFIDLTGEEREAFQAKMSKRFADTMRDYYLSHPEKIEELRRFAR